MNIFTNEALPTATNCAEVGVDFSFRTAFRKNWGLVNLLQIAGRAVPSGISGWKSQMADWLCWIIYAATQTLGYMAGVLPLLRARRTGFDPL